MALVGAQFVNAVSPNPVGSLQAYAGASAPTGWLLCDGTSYSTSAYPELFSVLAYTYGGSGANFNVPDLRGRMPIGAGTGAQNGGSGSGVISGGTGITARTRGQFGGDTRLQQHSHDVRSNNALSQPAYYDYIGGGTSQTILRPNTNVTMTPTGEWRAQNTGSGSGENMPPFLVTTYIIKAVPDAPRSGLAYGSTPPIVTQLPSNPQFGDVVTYIADAANGVAWNLQYDASGTYPWKFIGGGPMYVGPISGTSWSGSENTASTTYTTTGFTSCAVTAPLAGDYDVIASATMYITGAHLGGMLIRKSSDGTSYGWQSGHAITQDAGNANAATGTTNLRFTGLTSGEVLRMEHSSSNSATALYVWSRRMSVTPIRVKAA